MKEEELQTIEDIFHAASEVPVEQRSMFLDEVCDGDVDLRQEVESLIGFAEVESSLIDSPPIDVAAELFGSNSESKLIGKEIGHYKILSRIGIGGMGEVYLAEDSLLGRKAAIKFIKAEFADVPEQLRRFLLEAKAASSLNHPNILTVYEIGNVDGTHFIATEFIEGKTLRKIMSDTRLSHYECLEIAFQITTALSAAHSAGIFHRDIKPENIMLREDNLVKILDFGLAKLAKNDSDSSKINSNKLNIETEKTSPGLIMGTASYLSPEQARMEDVDARSDIWSFGVVFFEMISGQKPFDGQTSRDVIESAAKDDPQPIGDIVSEEIQQIITKCLQKTPEERYQNAESLLVDLRKNFETVGANNEPIQNSKNRRLANNTSETAFRISKPLIGETSEILTGVSAAGSSAKFLLRNAQQFKLFSIIISFILIFSFAIVGYFYFGVKSETANSVAVLPFTNESGDSDMDFLSNGVSDSIIESLSQLSGLKVVAKNSSFQFKDNDVPVGEIARKLNVEFILRGRIVQRGNEFQVIAELIRANDTTKIWGEEFGGTLVDLLNVESEISQKVADRMQLQLTGTDQQKLIKRKKIDPKAYKLVIKGRFYQSKGQLENALQAINYYEQALAIDPSYAEAYVEKANSYLYLGSNSFLDPKEAIPKAKDAANKALELDENLAQLHLTLAGINRAEWNWAETEREYKRALELNPNLAEDYLTYAYFLSTQGRHAEAMSFIKKGRDLDPLRLNIYSDLGLIYYFGREYDAADEQYKIGIELNPNHIGILYGLAALNAATGNYEDAIKYYEKTNKLLGDHTGVKCYYGFALAKTGRIGEARTVLNELETGKKYVSPVELAVLFVGLSEVDKAFTSLERAYSERDSQMQFLGVDPHLDGIRSDQRFVDLMKRVGLSPENYH